MKKKMINSLILAALLCTIVLTGAGCSKKKEEVPVISPMEITLSINYPDKSNRESIKEEAFKLEERSTVLEAIQLYCKVNDMPMLVNTTEQTVQGINGIQNGDIDKEKSWKFTVNGKILTDPENLVILEDGDKLVWMYSK